nr:MAG TPA: RNA polymerase sigma factor [Caudoviricetes sp.]
MLTEKQRMYLLAYYSENLTMDQLADRFGVNKSTISRSVQRAKKNLRDYLWFSL